MFRISGTFGPRREGIESWWGPGGFAVKVRKLDLRPGGELLYTMTAVDGTQIEFTKKAGMPLSEAGKLMAARTAERDDRVGADL